MHSLQGRVVAIVLAISAGGMSLLAGITYAEQRSFLFDRVDQQVREAAPAVERVVRLQAAGLAPPLELDERRDDSRRPGRNAPPEGTLPAPPGPGAPPVNLPPGTFGEVRSARGTVLGSASISYGDAKPHEPKLPARIKLGEIVTAPPKQESGPDFRVAAYQSRDGSSLVIVGVPLHEASQTLSRLIRVEAVVIAGVLILLGVVSWALIGIGLKPLGRMARTADGIAGGDISSRVTPEDDRTEIGRLGRALNSMLDRLENAFAQREASERRLRQFLSDASHELRTPLTSIRGYAELIRMGATNDPNEADRAIHRIESEAGRMGLLVDNMLQLARLDEVAEPVREIVDMSQVVRDGVADATAAAPDREISLKVSEQCLVLGDRNQLQQVIANLLNNALSHTPAGSPIAAKIGIDGASVRVDVRDFGPGLPSGNPHQLFERFWRAEQGRKRGKAGAGLGLAIVAEIVTSHGGRVDAANETGEPGGARFSVWLPRAEPTPD